MAYSDVRDQGLALLETEHLFRRNTTVIGVRRGHYLRGFAYRFMTLCSEALTEAVVKQGACATAG